jgi:hypothetical protein
MKSKLKKKKWKLIKIMLKKISGIIEINITPKMKVTFILKWKILELDSKIKLHKVKK